MTAAPIVFLDIETTGLHPDLGQPWDVGLIDRYGMEHEWRLPVDLGRADPISLKIGEYRKRTPSGTPTVPLADFASEFAALCDGCHLAGAVVSFDEERLRRLLRADGECESWHYHLVDVEALAAGYLLGKAERLAAGTSQQAGFAAAFRAVAAPPWDSGDLSRAVGVNPDAFDKHTGIGDARWARAVFEACAGPIDYPPAP